MQKTKLKPILPSLREKKRYLVFEVISGQKTGDFRPVWDSIRDSFIRLTGHLGMAKAGLINLDNKWDASVQRGILKVSHKHVDAVRASLTMVKDIEGNEVIVRSLGVSGILKKAEENYLRVNQEVL